MPEMYFALYKSKALVPATASTHNEILKTSQKNNKKSHVTGFLHREGDTFVQYLEGPKSMVFETLFRIGRDTRHTDFEILHSGPAPKRLLEGWQMGMTDSEKLTLSDLLEMQSDKLELSTVDPLDLVTFMIHNAEASLKATVE